jgi:hypothetical protein
MYANPKQNKKTTTIKQITPKQRLQIQSIVVQLSPSYSQKALGVAWFPLKGIIRSISSTSLSGTSITEYRHCGSTNDAASDLVASKLSLQAECFLLLLAQFALNATDPHLSIGVALVELIDVLKKAGNLILGLVHVFGKLDIDLLTSINLRLEVLHSAINIPKRALFGTVLILLVFEVSFEL